MKGDTANVCSEPTGVFNFLGLPGELRNKIYHLCLYPGQLTSLWDGPRGKLYGPKGKPPSAGKGHRRSPFSAYCHTALDRPVVSPKILRVNRQVYSEARAFLYQATLFCIFRADDIGLRRLYRWLCQIGSQRAFIQYIEVPLFRFSDSFPQGKGRRRFSKVFAMLQDARQLRVIYLETSWGFLRTRDEKLAEIFYDNETLRNWLYQEAERKGDVIAVKTWDETGQFRTDLRDLVLENPEGSRGETRVDVIEPSSNHEDDVLRDLVCTLKRSRNS